MFTLPSVLYMQSPYLTITRGSERDLASRFWMVSFPNTQAVLQLQMGGSYSQGYSPAPSPLSTIKRDLVIVQLFSKHISDAT